MAKNVVLYTRVSTDEQAEKNLSIPSQIEKLKAFCRNKGWNVLKIYEEDYSAWKTFDRPEYNKLKTYVQENKKKVDYVLFIQWSRFSRNISQAFAELDNLKKMGIEANAIEQWVDLSIPETAYLLAIYLAAPQVENERLSLRVKAAIVQGLKQGKWMGRAPYGYYNDKTTKLILPDPKASEIVAYAFNMFSKGVYTIEEVRRMANEKGLKLQKQQFINMLSNPLYIGKIYLKPIGGEPEQYIKGLHSPIVDDEIFFKVQDILNGKRKPYQGKTKGEELPLKGYLICPDCGRVMTGSASRSRNGNLYHYYHCQRIYGCRNSFSAPIANEAFESFLSSLQVDKEVLSLYSFVLEDVFQTSDREREQEKRAVLSEIENLEEKITNLDDKMLKNELTTERYNRLIETLEEQKKQAQNRFNLLSQSTSEYGKYIQFSTAFLADLAGCYKKVSLSNKQRIIGSIFPEKFEFDGKKYRTARINEVFSLICSLDKGLAKRKPGTSAGLSSSAPPAGLEPATL